MLERLSIKQLALWLPVILVLGVYSLYEVGRFTAKKQLCYDNYLVHHNFTQESICNQHAYGAAFQALNLTNCEKANKHVVEETPMLCAVRNWFMTSWFVHTWNLAMQGLHIVWHMIYSIYERSTNMVMIVLVFPICGVVVVYFYIQDQGTTARLAITQETQSAPMKLLAHAMNNQQILVNNEPAPAASGRSKILKRTKSQSRIVRKELPEDF